ncbi:hypothetical protein D1224_10875 [Henriciella barbarensis]|uniref:UvrD-like helicase ATP-binding domain-containing protein n=1 Tax=Henriciella barbarensis TaxID=86342 RepID=A0A399QT91_9PROT|nr:UvrD-helicase domain-containing protein [Henriciella barbarensis]RIJ22068.1 hypothetical protein D1224_10875 [Henriciella barbarensis]
MEISSGRIGSLLGGVRQTTVSLELGSIRFATRGEAPRTIAYQDVVDVQLVPKLIGWADISVRAHDMSLEAKRLPIGEARSFEKKLVARVQNGVAAALSNEGTSIVHLSTAIEALLAKPMYIANRDRQKWIESYLSEASLGYGRVLRFLMHPMFQLDLVDPAVRDKLATISEIASDQSETIKSRNRKFVEGELLRYKSFFEQVESRPLTNEQRQAAVTMEDRNLLVAPAGSGKTSALVGRIGYILMNKLCEPAEILVVAFNNSAREELRERITSRLSAFKGIDGLQVHTFHSLGQKIIAENTAKKPSLAKTAEDDFARGKLLQKIVDTELANNSSFKLNYIYFRALYAVAVPDPSSFRSKAEWHAYVQSAGETDPAP